MKWQQLRTTLGSRYLALVVKVLDLVEDSDVDPASVSVPAWLASDEALGRLGAGEVVVEVRGLGRPGERLAEDVVGGVRVVVSEGLQGPSASAAALYEVAPLVTLRSDRQLLRELARRTSDTGIEYMVEYLDDGTAAFLEGERYAVRLPFISSLAALHTHPEGACGLSTKDVDSALYLLTEGGLFSGAVTETCAYLVYRLGPVLEDEYLAVKAGRSWEGLRSIKTRQVAL